MPAYSLVRACMLDSKGVAWHQAPGWFQLKCKINCFEEKIWSLNCLCVFFVFFLLASFEIIYYIDKYCSKRILVPHTLFRLIPYMLLFESSVSSAFWNVLSYSVIRAYSVSDFEKCTTLFRYFSLLCYLELRNKLCVWFHGCSVLYKTNSSQQTVPYHHRHHLCHCHCHS